MEQNLGTYNGQSQPGDAPQQAGKLVISAVVTHEKLIEMIKQRNPIIASRDMPKR